MPWIHVYAATGVFIGEQSPVSAANGTVALDRAYEVTVHAVYGPQGLAELECIRAVPEGVEPLVLTSCHVTPFSQLAQHVSVGYRESAKRADEQRKQSRALASGLVLAR